MSAQELTLQFVEGMKHTSLLEYIAVLFGIISVLLSRMEHVWVFPTGLVNTILYAYLCFFSWGLYAEASVNVFYTAMSVYGWYLWTRKSGNDKKMKLKISASTIKEWILATGFFALCWATLFFILKTYSDSTVPLADSFAGAAAYTAMLLMAKKIGELDLVDCHQHSLDTALLLQRGSIYQLPVPCIFSVGGVGVYSMEEKVGGQLTSDS